MTPKSRILTLPPAATLMFAGLRSRWMMPFSCAYSRASAICWEIVSASSIVCPEALSIGWFVVTAGRFAADAGKAMGFQS